MTSIRGRKESLGEGGARGPLVGRLDPRHVARLAYAGVLLLATLAPLEFDGAGLDLGARLAEALRPDLSPGAAVDVVRNLVLFGGWGLVLAATERGSPRAGTIRASVWTGLLLSLVAEGAQLGMPARNPAVLDLLANGIGAGAGAAAGLVLHRALSRWCRRPTFLGFPLALFALPYLGTVLVEAAFPLLRSAELQGAWGGPLRRSAIALSRFEWASLLELPLLDAVLFAPAGFLVLPALVEGGRRAGEALRIVLVTGAGVALLGEAAHAPLGRALAAGPLLLHAAAVGVGGWLARWMLGRLPSRERRTTLVGTFLLGYLGLLLLWWWRPFLPSPDPAAWLEQLGPGRWRPLGALGVRRDLYSVSDVFRSFLLLAPVGGLLALRPLRRPGTPLRPGRSGGGWSGGGRRRQGWPGRGWPGLGWSGTRWAGRLASGVWPALGLALVLELGQIPLADRFFDLTDPLVAFGGAAVTWSLTRRALPGGGREGGAEGGPPG